MCSRKGTPWNPSLSMMPETMACVRSAGTGVMWPASAVSRPPTVTGAEDPVTLHRAGSGLKGARRGSVAPQIDLACNSNALHNTSTLAIRSLTTCCSASSRTKRPEAADLLGLAALGAFPESCLMSCLFKPRSLSCCCCCSYASNLAAFSAASQAGGGPSHGVRWPDRAFAMASLGM